MSDINTSSGSDDQSIDNLWGEAMTEQHAAGMTDTMAGAQFSDEMNLILDIPVKMTVELGRTKMTIKELLRLSQGSVVSLDGLAGEPLDILINGYLIAQGEVVVVSDKFGIRITDIITPSERMHRLSR
ncbi:flagellar motor switch protein FliN [Enterobacter cloacae]|uniref:flagellar motor switch protein FliN n=1 Tax=Enterobacter cloacae TaxID=550 RepID=UPI0021D30BEE|nr:flagellar motor switch protein FliN [Enterobacter cloacae]MCU6221630.1 flagellar motor switch protein FliN [Enterobacter cloacae]